MKRALGSNRASYGRKEDLKIRIRLACHTLGMPVPNLRRLTVAEIEEVWRDLYEQQQTHFEKRRTEQMKQIHDELKNAIGEKEKDK